MYFNNSLERRRTKPPVCLICLSFLPLYMFFFLFIFVSSPTLELVAAGWLAFQVADLKARLSAVSKEGTRRLDLALQEFSVTSAMAGQKARLRLER